MPFVTVVTLGSASDLISSGVRGGDNIEENENSTLTSIRPMDENEIFEDFPFKKPPPPPPPKPKNLNRDKDKENHINNNINNLHCSTNNLDNIGNIYVNGHGKRKSVSFVDLSSVGKLSTVSESGYSSGSSSGSSNSSNGHHPVRSVSRFDLNLISENSVLNDIRGDGSCISEDNEEERDSFLQGDNGQGRSLWKSWIRNKLNLNKNGKYILKGSLNSNGSFGNNKANKSLLIECSSEIKYSDRKFYTLKRKKNIAANGKDDGVQVEEIDDFSCNLFVRQCLKTYSTPFYELEFNDNTFHHPSLDTVDSSSPNVESPRIVQRKDAASKARRDESLYKAPDWFWSQSRGINLDEAGIALEGKVFVIESGVNIGERFCQIKWEEYEERFFFIIWATEAGGDFIKRVDLGSMNPIWHNEKKLTLLDGLLLYGEQKRNFFRDLYTFCAELGSFERSAQLASLENVDRVHEIFNHFQRVDSPDSSSRIKNESNKSLAIGKPKISSLSFSLQIETVEFRLKTENGTPIEPYFISVSIFDAKNSRKISEDFKAIIDINGKCVELRKALFRVNEPNEQTYVVVRVEKTLHALDPDAYFRTNPDGKIGSRISNLIQKSPLYSEKQSYRSPFVWTFFRVSKEMSGDLSLDFYKHHSSDAELMKILSDLKVPNKPEKNSKLASVPGLLKVKLEVFRDQKNVSEQTSGGGKTISVIEFPSLSCENFTRFSHLLFVYPLSLNLSNLTKLRARNILCRVFLRSEDDIEASPLDQYTNDGSIGTYVLHHRSSPEWYSEIKIPLPVLLDTRLHLLFQFFHISCSFEKVNKSKQVENLIGFAWLPLLNKFRFIGGEHQLPLASNLPSGYLQIQPLGLGKGSHFEDEVSQGQDRSLGSHLLQFARSHNKRLFSQKYSGPDIGWLDKCTFTVKLNLVSTIWTKCGCLGAFFAFCEKYLQQSQKGTSAGAKFYCDDENTVKAIRSLESIDLSTLRDFFPTIINQICNIALISNAKVASAALKFLIFSFQTLQEAELEDIITNYIDQRFLAEDNENNNNKKTAIMAEVLVDQWISLFEVGDVNLIASSLFHSHHIFSMIIKSMAIHNFQFQATEQNFNPEECKLVKLIQLFTNEIVQRTPTDYPLSICANENLISFICKCLSICTERYVIFSVINAYLGCFGPGDLYKVQDFKFNLLCKLVEHPLFLELNSQAGDDEFTRLDNLSWTKRHFLVSTIMKQSRSGLGEVPNVRSLALKPILLGLCLHEKQPNYSLSWIPWLRVVSENLHRVSNASLKSMSSRCSSVSTNFSCSTASTLIQAAISKKLSQSSLPTNNNLEIFNNNHDALSNRGSTLNIPNGFSSSSSVSQHSSMTNINSVDGCSTITMGERLSNCDFLDAISAIKTSNPNASTTSIGSGGSDHTIVNENNNSPLGSAGGDGQSITKESSDISEEDGHIKPSGTNDAEKSNNVVLRRYDKLSDSETSQLLLSGIYILKTMRKEGLLKKFWSVSTSQERSLILQMIHLACSHFANTSLRKNSTITRKKVVGILVPQTIINNSNATTNPPSPRTSLLPGKKWSSLPSKSLDGLDTYAEGGKVVKTRVKNETDSDSVSDWNLLTTETSFVCIDTLQTLCESCTENNEMRDIIRTTLDVAKDSRDTRAMLGALQNLYKVEELANIVFTKGNEDLSHQLFCELLSGLGTSYLINICVSILTRLYFFSSKRTTSQALLAIASLTLTPAFVHNFRKSLAYLERSLSVNERSSFVESITDNLSFIDLHEFDPQKNPADRICKSHEKMLSQSSSPCRKIQQNTITGLSSRLASILNSLWQLKSCHNEYRSGELYLKLANSYSTFAKARLRIDSFDLLKEEHKLKKRFSEALLCELHVASILSKYSTAPGFKRIMLGISQNLEYEFEEEEEESYEDEDSTEELIQRLDNCVDMSEKSERYELMIELYKILVNIHEAQCNYAALEHSYKQMSKACGLIQNKRERFLATYYRVALYYPRKVEDATRPIEVFVYKEPNVTTLMEICFKVVESENAVIFSGDVDDLKDDDKIYATITCVTSLPSESPRFQVWSEDFRRHQNINQFNYDTPFAMKSNEKISIDNKAAVHQQWKRRTTIKTEYTFPAIVFRLRVIETKEENLSPILVAIDDMERRVAELRPELLTQDIKRIQLRLQGSISVQVNQGPMAYARAFLEKENEFPLKEVNRLKAIFTEFAECCGELLVKNAGMIPPEQIKYQQQLEADYEKLCQFLVQLNLNLPELPMSRISISSC